MWPTSWGLCKMNIPINTQRLTCVEDLDLLTPGQDIIRIGRIPYLFLQRVSDIVSVRGSPDGRWEIQDLSFRVGDVTFNDGSLQVTNGSITGNTYIGGGIKSVDMDQGEAERSRRGFYERQEELIKLGLLKPLYP